MRIEFTEKELNDEINKVIIEEDDVILIGEYIEGEGKKVVITGSAVIEEETYHEFQVEVELKDEIQNPSCSDIMNAEWEWYDYLCWWEDNLGGK